MLCLTYDGEYLIEGSFVLYIIILLHSNSKKISFSLLKKTFKIKVRRNGTRITESLVLLFVSEKKIDLSKLVIQ